MSYTQIAQQQQITREELARARQVIVEMQHHCSVYENQVLMLQRTIKDPKDALELARCIVELNQKKEALDSHIHAYNRLIQLANVEFPNNRLSDQARREIYHLYYSGRYTQVQLAEQYGVQQSTISKIINNPQPT